MKAYWNEQDFEVFETPGLERRMERLASVVRPKFEELGKEYSSYFSGKTGDEFFPHVAKHVRRKVNPPDDSWVAFAPYKRGYKGVPHFQVGMWKSHVFIILAVIYEAPGKTQMAEKLLQSDVFESLPNDLVISGDHMKPDATPLGKMPKEDFEKLLVRLRDVKKGEFVIGRHISREEAASLPEDEFKELLEKTFNELLPVYETLLQK